MSRYLIKTLVISLALLPAVTLAQASLPSAGLTPESKLYFLDKFGEAIRELFTFSAEGKARLEVTFAAERIAEIKVVLEQKGVDAKGLETAQSRLQAHIANAAAFLEREKSKGKDVAKLAKDLDDDLEDHKDSLSSVFKEQLNALKNKAEDLKQKIKAARDAGNAALVDTLGAELALVRAEIEKLEDKEDEHEEEFENEKDKIEREVEDKSEAEEAIKDAEEERVEVAAEAAKDGVTLPADTFVKFDRLLAQAKELLVKGNYQGAEQLAEQAEDSLEKIKDDAEDLDEAMEKEDELKDKREESLREDAKDEAERLEEAIKDAEEDAREAQERLREGADDDESDD